MLILLIEKDFKVKIATVSEELLNTLDINAILALHTNDNVTAIRCPNDFKIPHPLLVSYLMVKPDSLSKTKKLVFYIDKVSLIDELHVMRRDKRNTTLAKLDLQMLIPNQATQTETSRQEIRDKYAQLQEEIETTDDLNRLGCILEQLIEKKEL